MYADMCLCCPHCGSLSKEKHLWASGGSQRWTAFLSHCVLFNAPWLTVSLFKRPRPSGAERWAQIRQRHGNVAFINISLVWSRKRRAKMGRSASWPQPAAPALSLITLAPCNEHQRRMGTVHRGRHLSILLIHSIDRRGLWDRCPLTCPVVNLMSSPAGDHPCPQLFSVRGNGPPLAWVNGHGNRLQAVSPLCFCPLGAALENCSATIMCW